MTSLLYKLAGVCSAIVMMIYDSRYFAVKVILILVQDIMIDESDLNMQSTSKETMIEATSMLLGATTNENI